MSSSPNKADDRQVGGTHYKNDGEQHWTRMFRLFGPGYFIGCITKYVERYRKKNGLEDLKKAQHFLEKLIELESPDVVYIPNNQELGEPGRSYVDPDSGPPIR